MSKARQLADNGAATPNRNMIINGAMNVAQRATSVTGLGTATGYFTCDRWKTQIGATTAGRLTQTQTADGPVGFANCLKFDCTTADTSIAASERLRIVQLVEGQNLQRIGKGVTGAQQVTVSFYVKANAAFTFGLELFDNDNTRQITKLFATTTGWVKHQITFPADVDDGSSPFDDDNAGSLDVSFWLNAGATYTGGTLNTAAWANYVQANRAAGIDNFFSSTDNNFFLTGVQVEVGPAATPFEHEEISTTLNKCKRYYTKIAGNGSTVALFAIGQGYTADGLYADYNYPVTMRARPTALEQTGTATDYFISEADGSSANCTSVPTFGSATSKHGGTIVYTSSGKTAAGEANGMYLAANGYLAWESEL